MLTGGSNILTVTLGSQPEGIDGDCLRLCGIISSSTLLTPTYLTTQTIGAGYGGDLGSTLGSDCPQWSTSIDFY
jgi:hypothetical protein